MLLNEDPWERVMPEPDYCLAPRAWNDFDLSGSSPERPEPVEFLPPDHADSWEEL